jgi:hypothetical protein
MRSGLQDFNIYGAVDIFNLMNILISYHYDEYTNKLSLCSSIPHATYVMASMVHALRNRFVQHAMHFYFLKT